MAPKRAAKKAAPPPPPPPAESSDDETRSGSRSRSEESEDEDAIAESPVPAATPALKNAPAPALKGDESESTGEEEEEDEEEEEEEEQTEDQPARAAPKNQPPPPQAKEDSETSGDEEDGEDEEEEDEEEEPTRAAPPSAQKKQPPQPAKKDDSDTSGDEEEEAAPLPKPAPKKDAAALKPPALALAAAGAADEGKKPGGFQRIWSTEDDVRILEALAAHQKQHGTFPQPDALADVLAGKLDNHAFGSKELQSKVRSLKQRYTTLSRRGEVPSKEHDRRVLDLSKIVWDGDKAATPIVSSGEQKGFEEMCELYPYLAEEVKELEAARPGMCKREFGKLDDDKARSMDEKIKKQRVVQIRVEMRHADLVKEVTKALMDVVDG